MSRYHNLPGVFTINEINVDIQKQLDKIGEEQIAAKKLVTEATKRKDEKVKEKDDLTAQLYKDCWKKNQKYTHDV